MKVILGIILFIIIGSFVVFLLPLAISIIVAYFMFSDGNIVRGIIAIVVGLLCTIFYCWYMFSDDHGGYSGGSYSGYSGGSISGDVDDDCPYCGSGDTDGNHCYTCDDDF